MRSGVLAFVTVVAASSTAEEPLSYNRDIRPILSENCFKCHGPDANARKAKLRLDVRADALANRGGYFAIDPGNAEESELVLRIHLDDPEEMMPPPASGKFLTDEQRAILTRWIDEGAEYQPHWAYIPPAREPVSAVSSPEWVRNPVDAYILAKLDTKGLSPAPEADPVRLLRRAHFDLTGLPPTPREVHDYLRAPADRRFDRAVDRLLDSRHYGERMAMEWLDVVRFADTTGYHSDDPRDMHPYRDYVIDAYNENKPFDEFTIEQLAGDLFPKQTTELKIAAGYNRLNQITSEGGAQPKEYLAKYMSDRVRNLGSVWMGTTLGCAECHDHKFDPITAKNFYEFGAFFADIEEKGKYEHGNDNFEPFLRLGTRKQTRTLTRLEREREELIAIRKDAKEGVEELKAQILAVEAEIDELEPMVASTLITVTVEPREIRVLPRGNWLDESGEVVSPATPESLPPLEYDRERATRMDLAQWLVDERNPLTARVVVNRLWAQFFGRGLAPVPDDFGAQGRSPSHPELLDWLAVEFMESGWDVKHIVRLIVTSNTYRQSTTRSDAAMAADPANIFLAGQNARRLPAELVRDNALAIAGLLNDNIRGPSAKPYQPDGYYKDSYLSVGKPHVYKADSGRSQYRRGMYTFWKRTYPHPSMLAFDAPTREECTAERNVSNTPQQALVLLNDPSYVEAARVFAARILLDGGNSTQSRIAFATERALSRPPTPAEAQILSELCREQFAYYAGSPAEADALLTVGYADTPDKLDRIELAAWTQVARALLNTQEAITRY